MWQQEGGSKCQVPQAGSGKASQAVRAYTRAEMARSHNLQHPMRCPIAPDRVCCLVSCCAACPHARPALLARLGQVALERSPQAEGPRPCPERLLQDPTCHHRGVCSPARHRLNGVPREASNDSGEQLADKREAMSQTTVGSCPKRHKHAAECLGHQRRITLVKISQH